MANGSPKATSPLIGQLGDDESAPEIVIDGPSPSDDVDHGKARKTADVCKASWAMAYHDILCGQGAAANVKTFRSAIYVSL